MELQSMLVVSFASKNMAEWNEKLNVNDYTTTMVLLLSLVLDSTNTGLEDYPSSEGVWRKRRE
jgi:hypothetical protein